MFSLLAITALGVPEPLAGHGYRLQGERGYSGVKTTGAVFSLPSSALSICPVSSLFHFSYFFGPRTLGDSEKKGDKDLGCSGFYSMNMDK